MSHNVAWASLARSSSISPPALCELETRAEGIREGGGGIAGVARSRSGSRSRSAVTSTSSGEDTSLDTWASSAAVDSIGFIVSDDSRFAPMLGIVVNFGVGEVCEVWLGVRGEEL